MASKTTVWSFTLCLWSAASAAHAPLLSAQTEGLSPQLSECALRVAATASSITDSSPPDSAAFASAVELCATAHTAYMEAREGLDEAGRLLGDRAVLTQASQLATLHAANDDCTSGQRLLADVVSQLGDLPAEATEVFARASHRVFSCRPPTGPPSFGEATLAPDSAPTSLFGTASGGENAALRFGGTCVGSISRNPSHLLHVSEETQVGIEVFADYYEGDLTLVVAGPRDVWCNDDFNGLNPGFSGRLAAGRYEIYVGELAYTGYGTSYQIDFSTADVSPLVVGAEPTHGTATLRPGEAVSLAGVSTPTRSARIFGPDCYGLVGPAPNHRVEVPEYGRATLEVTSASDLTLVVTHPSLGTYCNDDTFGLNPIVSQWLEAGDWEVYVGSYGTDPVTYTLRVSDEDIHGRPLAAGPPSFGTLEWGGQPYPLLLPGVASGYESAAARFGPDCRGNVSDTPSHTLNVDFDQWVWIEAVARHISGAEQPDLTLAVTGPAGTFCSDDYFTLDPALNAFLTAGTYQIYVGEYTTTGSGTPYALQVAGSEPPDRPSMAASPLTARPEPTHQWGIALGTDSASTRFGSDCWGYVAPVPDFSFDLATPSMVNVGAASLGDLVLVVDGPSGQFCNDDFDGLDPRIEQAMEPGRYEVYVGEYSVTMSGTAYTAVVFTGEADETAPEEEAGTPAEVERPTSLPAAELVLPTSLPAAEVGPPASLPTAATSNPFALDLLGADYEDSTLGIHMVGSTFNAWGEGQLAGGQLNAATFGSGCVGWVARVPDYGIEVYTPGDLEVAVTSTGDTTLSIVGPSGPYCNDDDAGSNPAVRAYFDVGTYEVYVGSFSEGMEHPYRIDVSRSY